MVLRTASRSRSWPGYHHRYLQLAEINRFTLTARSLKQNPKQVPRAVTSAGVLCGSGGMNDMNGAADNAPAANGVINGGASLPNGEAEDYQHPMDAEEVSLNFNCRTSSACLWHMQSVCTAHDPHTVYVALN